MSTRIILVDDHGIVRKGLRYLIEKEPGLEIIGEADDGMSALKMAAELSPDLIIMDMTMPGMNGVEATRRIKAACIDVKVLCVSMYSDRRFVTAMLDAGASGYLLKERADRELIRAIRNVVGGGLYLCEQVAGSVVDAYQDRQLDRDSSAAKLTAREYEVLQLIAEGHTTKEIAARLHVSAKTVWSHRENVMRKLRIPSIAGLTKFAIREGITSESG